MKNHFVYSPSFIRNGVLDMGYFSSKFTLILVKEINVKYEEESKSNLNMAIKSQNHVVEGCTIDMLCPPA
jgi:hypothetical protein